MKKILVTLLMLSSVAFAQTAFVTQEEEDEWNRLYGNNNDGIIWNIPEETEEKSELEIKAEKVLNLMLDKMIAILEKDGESEEE